MEELTVGGVQLTRLKLLCCLLREGDCELRLAAVASDVLKDANSGALSLATDDTWGGGQDKTGALTLMPGVALEMGLMVVELILWPGWGLGGGRAGPSIALTPLTCVAWLEVSCWVEMRGFKASTLLTGGTRRGVACWVEAQGAGAAPGPDWGPGPTLPESTLLPVPVLTRDWVGRLISIELGDKLAPHGRFFQSYRGWLSDSTASWLFSNRNCIGGGPLGGLSWMCMCPD